MRASAAILLLGVVTFGATRHTQPGRYHQLINSIHAHLRSLTNAYYTLLSSTDCLQDVGSGFAIGGPPAARRVVESMGVRLVGGCGDGRSGELQFNVFNTDWRTVCYETFDYFDAQFACSFLGFPFVETIYEM